METYVNLHGHSIYSSLDGHALIEDYVATAVQHQHTHLALTDHGTMAGIPHFVNECRRHDIVPIVGMEAYVQPESRLLKGEHRDNFHLTLLAIDQTGYRNLCHLATRSNCEGFHYKPRVDWELLEQHHQGLVVLSGCTSGELAKAILAEDEERIKSTLQFYTDVFGERFFLEYQHHDDYADQETVNTVLQELQRRHGLRAVATNDSHFCLREEFEAQQLLVAVDRNQRLDEVRSGSPDNYFRPNEEMQQLFRPELLWTTQEIASWVSPYKLGDNRPRLPASPLELPDHTPTATMEILVRSGLEQRLGLPYSDVPRHYLERMDEELRVIRQMSASLGADFGRYLLMITDICNYCRDHNIRFGPRGSAAGSLVCWTLGISEPDPLKEGLFFERFLNPHRVELPDVDIDFADDRRDDVFTYICRQYGADKVAKIGTYATIGPKQALKDAAKGLQNRLKDNAAHVSDTLIKLIPDDPRPGGMPLWELVQESSAGDSMREMLRHPEYGQVVEHALALEGRQRGTGMHAAGVVVSSEPLEQILPLAYVKEARHDDTIPIRVRTQYEMGHLESLGLLKIDILGLKTLSVLDKTLALLEQRLVAPPDLWRLNWSDSKTWSQIKSGRTLSLFQIGAEGQGNACFELQPESIEDLALTIAVYRPGPKQNFPAIVERKNHGATIEGIHPVIDPVMTNTYGFPVYQEQIMQIAQLFAGYSLGEADLLRKAMGKKIRAKMAEEWVKFLHGALANGHDEAEAKQVWDFIEPFADYGFNRAHAICYAYVAFQTAWLKAHYPLEFYAAAMTVEHDSGGDGSPQERIGALVREAKQIGIATLPPDIEHPTVDFAVDGTTIRYGFAAVKDTSRKEVEKIIEARKDGPFLSVSDTIMRCQGVNKKTFVALAEVGALDRFGWSRRTLTDDEETVGTTRNNTPKKVLNNPSLITQVIKHRSKMRGKSVAMISLFDETTTENRPEYGASELLRQEQTRLGMFSTALPGTQVSTTLCCDVLSQVGTHVTMTGVLTQVNHRVVKKSGEQMASVKLLDESGEVAVVVFPRLYKQIGEQLHEGSLVILSGEAKQDRRWGPQVTVTNLQQIISASEAVKPKTTINILVTGTPRQAADKLGDLFELAEANPGPERLTVRYGDESDELRVSAMGVSLIRRRQWN